MIQLSIQSLGKRYGNQHVFDNLSYRCSSTILGIAGKNGSGKSTFLKCCTGLIKPSAGTVVWTENGESATPSQIKRRVGFAAPYIQLYEELSVNENLQFLNDLQKSPIPISGLPELLDRFQAGHLSDKLYGKLSTGQKQRVKLAAAVLKNPSVLVLDEPGSNLDEAGREMVKALTEQCRHENQMVLLASNLTGELDLCDEILDLNSQNGSNL